MSVYRGYEPAAQCSGGPTPGARALMSWFLGAYADDGGVNLGIYNCRPVTGTTKTTSLHGEGRACDLGVNPHRAQWGADLARLLRLHSQELGIQLIIWDQRIWSGSYPDKGWRDYRGTNRHVDHLHVELSRDAAKTLSAAYIEGIFTPKAPTYRLPRRTLYMKSSGRMQGEDVRSLQLGLNRVFPAYSQLVADGYYGPAAERVLKEFQRRTPGLVVDGVVGPATWAALARFGI